VAAEAFEDIVGDFGLLEDWEDRYRYVIELGNSMDRLDPAFQVPASRVDGCASQVWILPQVEGRGAAATFRFQGDSDAMIVRGLIAILRTLYNGLSIAEVLKVDAIGELARLGLDEHLSSQRSNGLRAMIHRIGQLAACEVDG